MTSTLLASSNSLPEGVVCITPANETSCPSTPPVLSGPVGTQLTVNVNIESSAALNGFEVWVKTDPNVLNPVSASISGTILPAPLFVADECINGVAVQGPRCFAVDGPGIVNYGVVCLGCLVPAPASGLLYSITYNIVGTSSSTVGFQTGCTGESSVTNSTVCVQITDGQSSPVPVTITDPEFSEPACYAVLCTNLSNSIGFNGITSTVTGSLSINQTTRSLFGTLSVTAVNSTGSIIFSATYSISVSLGPSSSLRLVLTEPSIGLAATCSVTLTDPPGVSCMVTRSPDVDHDGKINILDLSGVALSFDSVKGSPNYNPILDLNADGKVNIQDLTIVALDFNAPVY